MRPPLKYVILDEESNKFSRCFNAKQHGWLYLPLMAPTIHDNVCCFGVYESPKCDEL
jgi:hypothetical protein